MGVELHIAQGVEVVSTQYDTFVTAKLLNPPQRAAMTMMTCLSIIELAEEMGSAHFERDDPVMSITGREHVQSFKTALEAGLSRIDPRPLAYEVTKEPGGPTMIGQPTHVAPTTWLAGKEGIVRRIIEMCEWALANHNRTSSDPLILYFA